MSRSRPHWAQNGWLTELMNPRTPRAPSARYVRAGSYPLTSSGVRGPSAASIRACVSRLGTYAFVWNPATLPNGIISMKRTA